MRGGWLTIRAERQEREDEPQGRIVYQCECRRSRIMRSLPLPCPVTEDVSIAGMRDGILTLQLRIAPAAESVPANRTERLRHFTRRLGHWGHPSHQLRANP